ncbi:MAG: hypothetical protein IPF46_17770 [Saprospiraceae bacterium]|nr:hypothetical protein [Candidatus Vicinibacter affinis]
MRKELLREFLIQRLQLLAAGSQFLHCISTMPIKSVEGLNWYVGGGASVFFWNYDNDSIRTTIMLNCHLVSWGTLIRL